MMLLPCGPSAVPTGGAGVALPASSSIFSTARTFFFPIASKTLPLVDLLDLQEVELDRRLAAEHVDQHLELAPLGVDVVDLAVEVGEGAVHDPDALPDLELDPDLGRLLLHLLLDRLDLLLMPGVGVDDVPLRVLGGRFGCCSLGCHVFSSGSPPGCRCRRSAG